MTPVVVVAAAAAATTPVVVAAAAAAATTPVVVAATATAMPVVAARAALVLTPKIPRLILKPTHAGGIQGHAEKRHPVLRACGVYHGASAGALTDDSP